jgi:hypothetical protein
MSFSQLAEQYGGAFAEDVLNRSRSRVQLDAMPSMPYASNQERKGGHGQYESLSASMTSPDDYAHAKRM